MVILNTPVEDYAIAYILTYKTVKSYDDTIFSKKT